MGNRLAVSKMFEALGVPLRNHLNSWSAVSDSQKMGVFILWLDKVVGADYLVSDEVEFNSIGGKLFIQCLRQVIEKNYKAYAILGWSTNPGTQRRKRAGHNDELLLALQPEKVKGGFNLKIIGTVRFEDLLSNSDKTILPYSSAINDLENQPEGIDQPVRAARTIFAFPRDAAVRNAVLERANGKCEYCDEEGFSLLNGNKYLETHHIIALAKQGPDTMKNVIALCPKHHREAHYGQNAAALESKFQQILVNFI